MGVDGLALDGMPTHALEPPGRLAWDICPSRWNSGPLIVNFPPDSDTELVCFAPPGVSLYGERGLALATWRRGGWRSESEFISGKSPLGTDELTISEVNREIPEDFQLWAQRETVAHIERLSAFAGRRPHLPEWRNAAIRLRDELDRLEPGAVERCRIDVDVAAARSDVLEARKETAPPEFIRPTSMSRRELYRLAGQASLLLALYALYRLTRPAESIPGPQTSLVHLPYLSLGDALLWIYGNGHVAIAFGFLAWVFFMHHRAFKFIRNTVLIGAGLTVLPYLLLAPAGIYSAGPAHAIPPSAVPTMPAMHLCIAVLIGCSGALLVRSTLVKVVWLGYPFVTLAAVLASGPSNLLLSVIGGYAAAIVAVLLAWTFGRVRSSWRPPPVLVRRLPRMPVLKHS